VTWVSTLDEFLAAIRFNGVVIEELDFRERNAERSVGETFLIFEIQEVASQLILTRLFGGASTVVSELSNGA